MSSSSNQRVLRSGVVIADKYRIDEAVARGGFSLIYRGTHVEMERAVALKVLTLDDDIESRWLERFSREARLASQLTHPNTVTIFDYGQDERGFLYIVMEWVDGSSLYHHLQDHGSLGAREVAQISAQVLKSLGEAHQRGFLHRDLKPSNIMLTHDYDGRDLVKVLDFGIAKRIEKSAADARITHQGSFVGTPRYASPEQFDGGELTPAADIYSVGLLMWEALVGDPAVSSVNYGECVKAHLSSSPWRLPDAVQCPPGLATLLYGALAKAADQRYQTCRQMHQKLDAWLDSEEAREQADANFFVQQRPPLASESPTLPHNQPQNQPQNQPRNLPRNNGSTPPTPDVPAFGGHDERAGRELLAAADQPHLQSQPQRSGSAEASEASSTPPESGLPAERPSPTASPPPESQTPADTSTAAPAAAGGSAAPAEPARTAPNPAPRASGQRTRSRGGGRQTMIAVGIAAAALTAAGIFAVSDGDGDPSTPADGAVVDTSGAETFEADKSEADKSEADAGPTYSATSLWSTIRELGWSRIGQLDTLQFDDATQQSGRFRRHGKTVSVTIYETAGAADAAAYVGAADAPARAIQFGTTAVQIAPGGHATSARGVDALMSTLSKVDTLGSEASTSAPE